jgi:hypothetical protein
MVARQCIRTRGAVAEVYHAPFDSKVCITIRVGYGGFEGLLVCHSGKGFMVYPCENALDRYLNLSCRNMTSVFLIATLLPQLARDFISRVTVFCFQRDVGHNPRYEFALDIGYNIYNYRIGLMVCKLDEQIKDSK